MCGTSRWKAAKSSSKTMKNLDETGLLVAGYRHTIAQTAINMFRGEMYEFVYCVGYNNVIHTLLTCEKFCCKKHQVFMTRCNLPVLAMGQ